MFGTVVLSLFSAVILFLLGLRFHLSAKRRQRRKAKGAPSIAFFHPFCNDGGGGERVLWSAIEALKRERQDVEVVVFSGDKGVTKEDILGKAERQFGIRIKPDDVTFVFLRCRWVLEARLYPVLTMVGQSLGSVVLAFEALLRFAPDVFFDSMGFAFTFPVFSLVGGCKVGAYVHYPTISTDMLEKARAESLSSSRPIFRFFPFLRSLKPLYYRLFAWAYGTVGALCSLTLVNSSWTKNHIVALWSPRDSSKVHVVFPPCNTETLQRLPLESREPVVISIGQFRPEKDHPKQIRAFSLFLRRFSDRLGPDFQRGRAKLVLMGSCRNHEDEGRLEALHTLAESEGLVIGEDVEFAINVPFDELKRRMGKAHAGLHTMWCEHFGIGVVELMAAGVIPIAHNSGGPKTDIVVPFEDHQTGFLASTDAEYADALFDLFTEPLDVNDSRFLEMRDAARRSTCRFSDGAFQSEILRHLLPFIPHLRDIKRD